MRTTTLILTLLTAASWLAAQAVAPRAATRARRATVLIVPPVDPAWAMELARQGVALAGVQAAMAAPALQSLTGMAAELAKMGQSLAEMSTPFIPRSTWYRDDPPAPWSQQDPADSLYRAARSALNRSSYNQAVYFFTQIYTRYPRSSYTPDAYYWEAFARYRNGGNEALKAALVALEKQAREHPAASTRRDADELVTRIRGALARRGDQASAEVVTRRAQELAESDEQREARDQQREREQARREREQARRETQREERRSRTHCRDDDDDDKMAALNALLQMDSDRALPILKKVLARRDSGSVCLRRKAVFLVSQQESSESESLLLNAVRTDPDPEVREQAVFWLSQVDTEHAVIALDSILQASTDETVQEKAIFALSQHDNATARQALRSYAGKANAPLELREKAIFWLGQSHEAENATFLRTLFKQLKEEDLKEKVLFSLSQMGGRDNQRWLTEVAADATEPLELRKKAIFWLGQSDTAIAELFALYERFTDREVKESLIFAYSQRHEKAAVDKLIQIAKTEKDRELRKKAIFWLSQSDDPRVAELLAEILEKP